jgi:hypothetical protein
MVANGLSLKGSDSSAQGKEQKATPPWEMGPLRGQAL